MTTAHVDAKIDRAFLLVLLGAALVTNIVLTTHNWHSGFLIGHEFRQTQTAVITYYIEKQNNFSIRYETPIIGKPWEFPLEFPLYQWCVALLSRATGWPHFESARAVSMASFHLALPAVYLLLGQAGLPRLRRLLTLALLLATPVYLFYGRAFLMDTMAMMFSAWFLAAFVETMRTRRLGWLVLCAATGTAAGLVKSLTLFVWLFPAALYGAWCVFGDLKHKRGWAALGTTVAWGFGAVVVPAATVSWWIRFTDAIKENHASAYIFTSKGLTQGNFGMYELSARLSQQTWRALLECWSLAIAHPGLIGAMVVGGAVLFKAERWRLLGAAGLFIAAQMMFPYAYAYQDYYFTACTIFAVCALGFVLNGIFDSGLPRWCRWALVLAPFGAFYAAYAGYYLPQQRIVSAGGTGLTIALRDYLPKESVLVVAGNDWSAIVPYYSQHRALMIRNGLEHDDAYLERAFNDLSDEYVSALVLAGPQRGNTALVRRAAEKFNLDSEPTFTYPNADVYVSHFDRPTLIGRMSTPPLPEGIVLKAAPAEGTIGQKTPVTITTGIARGLFSRVHPLPNKFQFAFGFQSWYVDDVEVRGAHPDSALWVPVAPGVRKVIWEYGILPGAYEKQDKTNGVDFVIEAELSDGVARVLYRRLLDPALNEGDRGTQHDEIDIEVRPGETLVFRTQPNGSYAFDWAYLMKIDVR